MSRERSGEEGVLRSRSHDHDALTPTRFAQRNFFPTSLGACSQAISYAISPRLRGELYPFGSTGSAFLVLYGLCLVLW